MYIPDQARQNNAAFERHLYWVDGQDDLLLKLRFIDAGHLDSLPSRTCSRAFWKRWRRTDYVTIIGS